tara:strand:- start:412 stop:696 length:285 start_codon:yes stop_codon:yes gene_type:complete
MTKEIKIDDNLIEDVKKAREENNRLMFEFGNLKLERISLEQRMNDIEKQESNMTAKYKGNVSKEQKVAGKLKDKYGDGVVNLDKGIFIPNEDKK